MEAAILFGLSPRDWREHSTDDRARMVAHALIKAIREAYVMEQATSGDEKPREMNDYEKQKLAMQARAGLDRVNPRPE